MLGPKTEEKRGCIQKSSDWPPGARTANSVVLCHEVQLCILWVSLVSFATIMLRVYIIVVAYFVIDSVRKLLDMPS